MPIRRVLVIALAAALTAACHSEPQHPDAAPVFEDPASAAASQNTAINPASPVPSTSAGGSASPSAGASAPPPKPQTLPKPGNPSGHASVPSAGKAVDTSKPTTRIGTGTPAGCTSAAVVKAVAKGGIITFNCGPKPVKITMTATAKVHNTSSKVVIDGGNRVTLSGGGKRRILLQNTCDQSLTWTTSHCQDQDTPKLTVQNLAFADGNSTGDQVEGGGGGAIFVRGGRLAVINSRFTGNRCERTGPDLGGAAIRVLDQGGDQPVYVVGSTFTGGTCSNGSALSSIGVSWTVLNSVFSGNNAVGNGANPARSGTPGGGSGGAIYLDGDKMHLEIAGTLIERNKAVEGGGAIFFVSNDRTGTMTLRDSTLRKNPSAGFETTGLPGIFFLGATDPTITRTKLTE